MRTVINKSNLKLHPFLLCFISIITIYYILLFSTSSNENFPKAKSLEVAVETIHNQINIYQKLNKPLSKRNLIIFHIGDIGIASNSIDIAANNIKIFVSALLNHAESSKQATFYLFNVVHGLNNPLAILLPSPDIHKNMAILDWKHASSDLDTHLRTVRILGEEIISQFYSVIFLNQGVRGPLAYRKDGEWVDEMNKIMYVNNVALVGPTLSCEVSPHIQTHAFALKSSIIPLVLNDMEKNMTAKFISWKAMIESLEVGLTGVVRRAGYNVSSLLYHRRGYEYFQDGKCLVKIGPKSRFMLNPASWCDVKPEEVIFLKWGGEPMRTPGFMCNTTIAFMDDYIYNLSNKESQLKLTVPETLMGGHYYELYREYNAEIIRDRSPLPVPKKNRQPKVCFMVRVTSLDEVQPQENAYSKLINKDVELLITSKYIVTKVYTRYFWYYSTL